MAPKRLPKLIEHLKALRQSLVEKLAEGDQDVLPLKIEVDSTIQFLRLGERYNLIGAAEPHVLPPTRTRTPSSEYWLMEDHESNDPLDWTEVIINGNSVRPTPYDVIIEPRM